VSAQLQELQLVPATRVSLLGTGTVGSAFIARYQQLHARGLALPVLHSLGNSRVTLPCAGEPALALQQARAAAPAAGTPATTLGHLRRGDVVVDATASADVAACHAHWLGSGIHVVTANKLGRGADLQRAAQIDAQQQQGQAGYGDSATVGAGLPVLASLRALRAGGDQIHVIEGVLSGSLAWLFHRYDGSAPFSSAVREALQAGYTEPDPRDDLSGEDVRRKLLILARASGLALDAKHVHVESLVPAALAALPLEQALQQLPALDEAIAARWRQACAGNRVLRFVGRVDGQGAHVGLRELAADHPLAQGAGTDNRVAIHSDRYREQPLLIQGPGAGAEVTAAALLDDVLRIAAIG